MEMLVPILRFPEFNGNWQSKTLGEIGEFIGGGTPSTTNEEYWNGEINWFTPTEIKNDYVDNSLRKITQQGLQKSSAKLLPVGTILLTTRATIGDVAIAKIQCSTNQGFQSLITNALNNNLFIFNWLKKSKNLLIERANGSTFPEISKSALEKINLYVPLLDEQQKIATFLTSVDERIALLEKQKQGLETYKKGVMQQLFSQQLRFKDDKGNDFPDWEEKKLGELGNTFNGLTGKTKDDFGSGKPYIQYMQIFNGSKINIQNFGFVQVNEGENQAKVQYGDIFFTTSSETPNEIGTTSVLLDNVDEVYLNSFCFGFRPNSLDELVPEFVQFLFRSKQMRDKIVPLAQGSTRFNMSKIELMKLEVQIPCKKEQQKIASFLSAIDIRIEVVSKQIEQSKVFKKGLLQQMFV